jgi:hypothetical protein
VSLFTDTSTFTHSDLVSHWTLGLTHIGSQWAFPNFYIYEMVTEAKRVSKA